MWRLKFDERSRREPVNCVVQRVHCVILVFEDGDGAEKDDSSVVVELGRIFGEDTSVKVEEPIVDDDESTRVCLVSGLSSKPLLRLSL